MGGSPVELGPFSGGLNQLEDPRLIADGQLSICQNMDIGRAGELQIRKGLKLIRAGNGFAGNLVVIGVGIGTTGTNFVFALNKTSNTLYYTSGATIDGITGATTVWTQVSATTYTGNKMVQYNSTCYFINKSGASTGISVVLNDTATIGLVTTGIALPQGNNGFIFKDRLFVFGTTDNATPSQRVYYSGATTPATFPGANFFDINPGDGEGVNAAIVLQDSIIFFKRNSTYVLYFDTDPGLGTLRRVSSAIGSSSAFAVTQYENAAYVATNGTIYRLQNLLFSDIGRNLNLLTERTAVPVDTNPLKQDFVFVYGTKVVFAIYNGTGFSYFVYNVEVGAWVEYVFTEQPDRFFSFNDTANGNSPQEFIASKQNSPNLYRFSPSNTDNSNYGDYPANVSAVTVKTKKMSLGVASSYKRLYWWGMDILSFGTVNMVAYADAIASATAALIGVGNVQFFKAFLPARGRYFEFELTASDANQRLTIYPGIAQIALKNEVSNAVTT